MQKAIRKIDVIKPEKLSNEFYFNSLIEEAINLGIIDEEKTKKIQMECLSLLAKKSNSYSGGASGSIRTELAENILKSIVFVIGVGLKAFKTPDMAFKNLCEQGVETIYAQGKRRIGTKLKMAKQLHRMVLSNMIMQKNYANYAYSQTLIGGINGFFKLYNPEYSAHEINITLDYPTANPINDFARIELITEYLQAIFYENMFCSIFTSENFTCENFGKLLNCYSGELIINIYSIVLTNAIGCILLKKSPFELSISEHQAEFLKRQFAPFSKDQLKEKIELACRELFLQTDITSESLQKYIFATLPNVCRDMYFAFSHDTAFFLDI